MSEQGGCGKVFGYQCREELKHLVTDGPLKGLRTPPYFTPNHRMICGPDDGQCPSCVAALEDELDRTNDGFRRAAEIDKGIADGKIAELEAEIERLREYETRYKDAANFIGFEMALLVPRRDAPKITWEQFDATLMELARLREANERLRERVAFLDDQFDDLRRRYTSLVNAVKRFNDAAREQREGG